MVKIFRYEINYYDELTFKDKFEKGIVAAKNYADAVSKLCSTDQGYGEALVIDIKVTDCIDAVINDEDLLIELKK